MANNVEITGLKPLVTSLKKIHPELLVELKTVHKLAADDVAAAARIGVPRRTGRLQKSIRTSAQAQTGIVRAGGTRAPYAKVIHFGWPRHHIEPRPFLYDALDKRRKAVTKQYQKALKKIVKKVV